MDFKERSRKRFKINAIQLKIKGLKDKLAKDDYKIIKCVEAYFINPDAPLPYDIDEMVDTRNAIRAEINELEAQVATLNLED